jgi:hypothetical protein
MVDINGKSYSDILKIKGTDKKIDLTKLEGLQKTKQNQAIFDMVDKNKDGVINSDEAKTLQESLLTSSKGNGTISKREANKHYGKNQNPLDAIEALSDQQTQTIKGEEYVEKNGDVTTHIYNSNVDGNYSYKYDSKTDADGNISHTFADGTQEFIRKDGTKYTIQDDGSIVNKDKNGKTISVMKDGNITTFPDEHTTITTNIEGQIIQTVKIDDEKITRTDFEYQDGKTIEREYPDVWESAPLTAITVREKKDGHNVDTKYTTEEDMTNNRPSEIVTDAHNPTQKTVTKFTYNEDGSYTTETTDSAGEKTVKKFDAEGKEIVEQPKPEIPTTHKVIKGESITKIVTDALAQQGIENPTPEQLKEAKKEFLELNKDLVKTYKGVKKEWHGNKFFYPDDVVKIPSFTNGTTPTDDSEKVYDDGTIPEVVITAKRPSQETIARRREVQEQLGDKYDVGYDNEGNIEVRDLKGNVLPKATKMANDGIKTNKPTETQPEETLSEEENEAIAEFDDDKSGTLDKDEYTKIMMDQIESLGLTVDDSNKAEIQKLIDEAFAKIDEENNNGILTKEELAQKGTESVALIADRLEAILMKQTNPVEENTSEKTGAITITDGSNYDIKNDTTYIATNSQIKTLEKQLQDIETQYKLEKDKPDIHKMGFDAYSQYSDIKFELEGLKNDKRLYENSMSNWKDGNMSKLTINYHYFEGIMRTLSNGQRAYEIEGKLYELDNAGFPDFSKEISINE